MWGCYYHGHDCPHLPAPSPPVSLSTWCPVCSMPACLPPLLARAAEDEDEGLPALQGSSRRDSVFPQDVSALVDLSGKRWAHTAVIRLPFPDVDAVSQFVRQQLSDDDCHLSAEERSRNEMRPALLLLSVFHPLAGHLLGGPPVAAEAAAAGPAAACSTTGGRAPSGGSILSLLLAPQAPVPASDDGAGVLCLPIDLSGQDTPPFTPGLLPGAVGSERCDTPKYLPALLNKTDLSMGWTAPIVHFVLQALTRGSAR